LRIRTARKPYIAPPFFSAFLKGISVTIREQQNGVCKQCSKQKIEGSNKERNQVLGATVTRAETLQ
jgi:hypothetical protein